MRYFSLAPRRCKAAFRFFGEFRRLWADSGLLFALPSVSTKMIRMKISREDVIRVAELAHLGLAPEEVDRYREQLDGILTYVEKLNELDLNGVEPMAQVLHASRGDRHPELREDTLLRCDTAKPILAQAPDAAKPFFRVPKVIEK